MREIKFRGKLIYNDNRWLYGYLHIIDTIGKGYTGKSIQQQIGLERPRSLEVIPETVGQFTGLLDKNGKDIYEGDIVKVIYSQYEDTIHEIKYFVDDYSYPAFDLEPSIDFADSNSLQYANLIYSLEVVGNIHDNKDLLK